MNIKFTEQELEKYPLLDKLEINMDVVAIKTDTTDEYTGLFGHITDIIYNKADMQTEREGNILEITVDFKVPDSVTEGVDESIEYDVEQSWLKENYSQLNGTSICDVILDETELGFNLSPANGRFYSIDGKYICPIKFITTD
jgi:hypothetical protein